MCDVAEVRTANITLINSPVAKDTLLFNRLFKEAGLPEERFNFLLLSIFEQEYELVFQMKIREFIDFIYSQFLYINGGMELFVTDEDPFTASDVIIEFIAFCRSIRNTLRENNLYHNNRLVFNTVWFEDNYSIAFARMAKISIRGLHEPKI